jgi:integrase
VRTTKLTDVNIKKAKSGEKTRKLSDGGGLYIQIEPSGGKLWRYKYRFEGKQKLLALGKYPDVSLQEVRERHQEARKQLAQGIDPSAAKQALKAARQERTANSFEVIAREWLETWKTDKAESHYIKVIARLENDVFPYIGGKPAADISVPEIVSVCRRIEERGAIDTAHRAAQNINQVIRYAVQTGRAKYNPCSDLRGALKPVRKNHFAALIKPADVADLMRAIDTYKGGTVVRAALRLAPLVFVRPVELRTAKWEDVDLDRAEWKYEVSKTRKTGIADHIVPLSRQAVEILKDLKPLTGGGEYVFPGINPGRPISDGTINKALRSLGYDTKTEHTGHGFRAMAMTRLREQYNLPKDVIDLQLAHKLPDSNKGAYDRVKFINERRPMMQIWADYLDELKATEFGKVVPFEQAAI